MSDPSNPARLKVIAFDMIGTVFGLESLRPKVVALGLPGAALEGWFAAAVRDAAAMAAAGDYQPFASVRQAALNVVLAEQSLDPPASNRKALLDGMAELPLRNGAEGALRRVTDAGVEVMALTNGSEESTRGLLDGAGVLPLFDHVVSTDEVRLAKPRPEIYRHACEVAGVRPAEFALVAAHSWDIQGGVGAGLMTAYLAADRPYSAAMRAPHVTAGTLTGCVEALLGASWE